MEIPLLLNQCVTFGSYSSRHCYNTLLNGYRESLKFSVSVSSDTVENFKSCGIYAMDSSKRDIKFPNLYIAIQKSSDGVKSTSYIGIELTDFVQVLFAGRLPENTKLIVDIGTLKDHQSGVILIPAKSSYSFPLTTGERYPSVDLNISEPDLEEILNENWTRDESSWKAIVSLTISVPRSTEKDLQVEYPLSLAKKLKMDDTFCDATITSDNGARFKSHRNILASQSSVFANMFQTDMDERKTGTVKLPGMTEGSIRVFRNYLYELDTSAAQNDDVICFELVEAAHKYDVPVLLKDMERILLRKSNNWYTTDVALRLFAWTKVTDRAALHVKAVHVLKSKVDELSKLLDSPDFLKTNKDTMNELFKSFATVECCICNY